MNKSRSGRFSGVRGTHLDVERTSVLPEAPPSPLKRITTRLRLQRVQPLPYVPASLYEYVERARYRRRAAWVLAVVCLLLSVVALCVYLSRAPARTVPNPSPRTEQPRSTERSSRRAPSEAPTPSPSHPGPTATPATPPTKDAPPAAPVHQAVPSARPTSDRSNASAKPAPPAVKPAADPASHLPKVSSDAPASSSSPAWWY